MTEHETIAGIIAEKRALADRLAREMAVAKKCKEQAPHRTAQAIIDSTRREADRLEAAHKREFGDCAKLREAVIGLRDRISMFYKSEWIPYDEWEGANDDADAALAAPPRNCDVGTAEEQHERHNRYCDSQHECKKCLGVYAAVECVSCFANWAQMPYKKEGGAK